MMEEHPMARAINKRVNFFIIVGSPGHRNPNATKMEPLKLGVKGREATKAHTEGAGRAGRGREGDLNLNLKS